MATGTKALGWRSILDNVTGSSSRFEACFAGPRRSNSKELCDRKQGGGYGPLTAATAAVRRSAERAGEQIQVSLERTVVLPSVKVKETGRTLMRRVEYEERRKWQMYLPSAAGFCLANTWLDGNPADTKVLEATAKEPIAAVEIYSRAITAPQQYVPGGSNCGVVLVWTKAAFRS
jgi:hypothetical protein